MLFFAKKWVLAVTDSSCIAMIEDICCPWWFSLQTTPVQPLTTTSKCSHKMKQSHWLQCLIIHRSEGERTREADNEKDLCGEAAAMIACIACGWWAGVWALQCFLWFYFRSAPHLSLPVFSSLLLLLLLLLLMPSCRPIFASESANFGRESRYHPSGR